MARDHLRVAACLLVLLAGATAGASAQALGAQSDAAPVPRVDENLFMLHLLGEYYAELPGPDDGRAEVTSRLAEMRQKIGFARTLVQTEGLDRDLDALYADALRLLDAYQGYLAALGVIDEKQSRQAVIDTLSVLWDTWQTARKTESTATGLGISQENAGRIAKLVAAGSGTYGAFAGAQRRDDARNLAIQSQRSALMAQSSAFDHRASLAADMLTRRYGWLPGEAGFDGFETQYRQEYLRHRPRDPFLMVRLANARQESETPQGLVDDADLCLRASQLVPARPAFSVIRNDFVESAAELAALAAVKQGDGSYSARPSSAGYVVSAAQYYLSLDPEDASGRGHMVLARGLAFSGRYREALAAATTAMNRDPAKWQRDPVFCFRYAMMLSLTGDRLDLVSAWLGQAYGNGWTQVAMIRNTQDLRNFRAARPDEFARLTQAKLTYSVKFGLFMDDVVWRNDSPFTVTHFTSVVAIRKGGTIWRPKVDCDSIPPGGSCIGENVVSVPDDRYDDISATAECDQCAPATR